MPPGDDRLSLAVDVALSLTERRTWPNVHAELPHILAMLQKGAFIVPHPTTDRPTVSAR